MPDIALAIAQGLENPWIFLPAAVLLGALHALEPGHSKSIMAAFIVATRGTWLEALVLGISAALGHTLVVWVLVLLGLWLGKDTLETEAYPWLVLISGLLILTLSLRLFGGFQIEKPNTHAHNHPHDHDHKHDHDSCGHTHLGEAEINSRYGSREVKLWEVIWFGFTGGLMPCPSALAVLLIALKLKKIALGASMVAAFSLGLAATLVGIGLIAAWGIEKAKGLPMVDRFGPILPKLSAGLVFVLGLFTLGHGIILLSHS